MSSVTINGVNYSGSNISINGTSIKIDGKEVSKKDVLQISIVVHGNIDNLNVDTCDILTVKGQVNNLETISGDVECYDVNGNIRTVSGDVKCKAVTGNITTVSGDIKGLK